MNTKLPSTDHWEFVKALLKRMFELSLCGVAADFMTTYVDYQQEGAFHASPEEVFAFAKTLSKRVALRHDYMPYEFAVYIYKNDMISSKGVFREFLQYDKDLLEKYS